MQPALCLCPANGLSAPAGYGYCFLKVVLLTDFSNKLKTGSSTFIKPKMWFCWSAVQVPTFLFFRNGKEVGRHVGSSRGDLIGQILQLQAALGIAPPAPPTQGGGLF